MSVIYTHHCRVDTRDTDPFGQCRPSALLGILQEAATQAAIELDMTREVLAARYNAFWMMARVWFRLETPLLWNDALTVCTWHRGGRGPSTYRDYDILRGGERVGEAVASWVLADVESHRLLRLSMIPGFEGTTGGALCKEKKLFGLHLPEGLAFAQRRLLQYSEADVNGHINNSRYGDYACDALDFGALLQGHFLSALQINFLRESRPGQTMELFTGRTEDGAHCARGADEGGEARFEARLVISPLLQRDGTPPPAP